MKKVLSLVLLISLLVSVAGCSAPSAPAESAPAADSGAAPAADAAADESILRVSFSWPNYIDPAVGIDYVGSTSVANLYDSLVFPNADGTSSPWLATEWSASEDGKTWTVKLRDDVKFHDGSAMKASDVVYSFNRLKTIGEGPAYLFENVASIEGVDDTTVKFTLNEPSGLFIPSLVRLYVVSEALVTANTKAEGPYGDKGDYGKDWLLTHDAGTGPYQVADFKLEEYLHMQKFDGWWGTFADNAPQEMRFIATTETATVRTLMADGELEISDQWQTKEAFEALDQIEGVAIAALPSFSEFYYMINTKLAPTDDVHCRRAMAYAFDYATAVGLEWPGTQQSKGPAPIALGGHKSDVFTFTRDLDKAKEELAQCKYAADIANYPIDIHWISEVPDEEKFALLFQANMAEIGMKVNVVSQPWLSVVENSSKQETSPHIVTIYVSADLPEAGPILKQRYHSSTTGTWSQNEWLLDTELDKRIDDALTTIDQTERFAKYAALQEEIAQMAPSLFIYDQVEKHAYKESIDWPAARGEASALSGYQIYGAHISLKK